MVLSWNTLDNPAQLAQLIERSHQVAIGIFKHSTRCGTSHQVKEYLENGWDFDNSDIEMYYLDLLQYRPISNQIAEQLNVMHQSPQLIVLKNGKVIYASSHLAISTQKLAEALSAVTV